MLDLTRLLPGAVATKLLLDAGFEVVKVEEPGRGDYMRERAPRLFSLLNGGKKSVAVDLKSGEGRALFLELAKEADVAIEGFRPGVVEISAIGPNNWLGVLAGRGLRGREEGEPPHSLRVAEGV